MKQTKVDLLLNKIKNYKIVAIIIVFGIAIVAICTLSQSILNVLKIFCESHVIEESILTIDSVQQIINDKTYKSSKELTFDIIFRNSSSESITISKMLFLFNSDKPGKLQSYLEVQGIYVVLINEPKTMVNTPEGQMKANVGYPSPDGENLMIMTPISQAIAPKMTDKIRVKLYFVNPSLKSLRAPLRNLKIGCRVNNNRWYYSLLEKIIF